MYIDVYATTYKLYILQILISFFFLVELVTNIFENFILKIAIVFSNVWKICKIPVKCIIHGVLVISISYNFKYNPSNLEIIINHSY